MYLSQGKSPDCYVWLLLGSTYRSCWYELDVQNRNWRSAVVSKRRASAVHRDKGSALRGSHLGPSLDKRTFLWYCSCLRSTVSHILVASVQLDSVVQQDIQPTALEYFWIIGTATNTKIIDNHDVQRCHAADPAICWNATATAARRSRRCQRYR